MEIKREKLKDVIVKATLDFERKLIPAELESVNPVVLKIKEIISNSDFSDKEKNDLAKILGEVLAEEIKIIPPKTIKYFNFTMVVPVKNLNGHNYPLGKPCLVSKKYGDNSAIKIDGLVGNNLDKY